MNRNNDDNGDDNNHDNNNNDNNGDDNNHDNNNNDDDGDDDNNHDNNNNDNGGKNDSNTSPVASNKIYMLTRIPDPKAVVPLGLFYGIRPFPWKFDNLFD